MATKITYKGKVHYWLNSFSTKAEAEKYAAKERKSNHSVVIKKIDKPVKGVGANRDKTFRYFVYCRILPRKK